MKILEKLVGIPINHDLRGHGAWVSISSEGVGHGSACIQRAVLEIHNFGMVLVLDLSDNSPVFRTIRFWVKDDKVEIRGYKPSDDANGDILKKVEYLRG